MDTDEYQAKLRALGVDRGKLASGFVEKEVEDPERPIPVTERMEVCITCGGPRSAGSGTMCRKCYLARAAERKADQSPIKPLGTIVSEPVSVKQKVEAPVTVSIPPKVPRPVKHCRCGRAISLQATRCRLCSWEDRRKAREEAMAKKLAEEQAWLNSAPQSLRGQAPVSKEPEPEVVWQWHILTQAQIATIAEAVIRGNGGLAREDDVVKVVREICDNYIGSMMGSMILDGTIGVRCYGGEPLYYKLSDPPKAIDWDYSI